MYKRRDKNTNFYVVHISQTKCSIKYISNIYGGMINMYLYNTGLEYLIG